ncbi:hypothetical protein EST38_g9876 [Candolleomyces aberdarensis]|uniref:F-box domain-containing protein n=1 Tax=Candolleomyces aberdarensis TaxID=2316362 RepID=A0A4Q2D9I4_9AGAR|nr:hypothetical protein EST38_g9876 [Candolleomyces aberdarensis]
MTAKIEQLAVEKAKNSTFAIFDTVPTGLHGAYRKSDDRLVQYDIWMNKGLYITFPSYSIFLTVAPELGPEEIFGYFIGHNRDNESGAPIEIDYGAVTGNGGFALLVSVCETETTVTEFWYSLLCNTTLTDEEILYEAWRGKGNLWAYTRPDRYLIPETVAARGLSQLSQFPPDTDTLYSDSSCPAEPGFDRIYVSRLPLDPLFLICEHLPLMSFLIVLALNKRLRRQIDLNHLAYQAMRTMEPWYLPSNPIVTPDGTRQREDLDWWEEQWLTHAGIPPTKIQSKIPWLKYWIQCSRSPSMRNRKRIWSVALQMKDYHEKQIAEIPTTQLR